MIPDLMMKSDATKRRYLKVCSRVIERDPQFAGSYFSRGVCKEAAWDHVGAIEDCTKAIEINPQHAQMYANLGRTKSKIGGGEAV